MQKHVRQKLVWTLVAGLAVCTPAVAQTKAKPQVCPATPVAASYQIWAETQLARGSVMTGLHPCGKKLECTGGSQQRASPRQCRWL